MHRGLSGLALHDLATCDGPINTFQAWVGPGLGAILTPIVGDPGFPWFIGHQGLSGLALHGLENCDRPINTYQAWDGPALIGDFDSNSGWPKLSMVLLGIQVCLGRPFMA